MADYNCNMCGVALTDENWAKGWKVYDRRQCKDCRKDVDAASNKTRMWVNGKYIPKTHPLYKPGRYKSFNDAAFSGTYKTEYIKEGYVYVITNKAWAGWVKIGMAFDPEDRCNGYQTSSPHRDYILEYSVASNDRRKAEQQAHARAAKLASEVKGEWFKLPLDQAKKVLDSIVVHVTIKEEPKQIEDKPLDLFSYAERLG